MAELFLKGCHCLRSWMGMSLLLMSSLSVLVGCGSSASFVWYSEYPAASVAARLGRLEPKDKIRVAVSEHPELSAEHQLSASGDFTQPLLGPIRVSGLSPTEAASLIAKKLAPLVQRAYVTVTLTDPHPVRVNVVGEVKTPGAYSLTYDESMIAVIARAGGLSDFADADRIFVVRPRPQPVRIRFRYRDLVAPSAVASAFALHDGDTILIE